MNSKKFNSLTKAQKRVAIAEDVLARINRAQFKPKRGSFINNIHKFKDEAQLCDIVNSDKLCQACAKGSLFLSFIGYVNHFTVQQVRLSEQQELCSKPMNRLSKIFTKMQLTLIETAFEGKYYSWNEPLSEEMEQKCIGFAKKHRTATSRLIAICENIIENKGTFKL